MNGEESPLNSVLLVLANNNDGDHPLDTAAANKAAPEATIARP